MSQRVESPGAAAAAARFATLAVAAIAMVAASLLIGAPTAKAISPTTEILPDGKHRTTYYVGPLDITSGQNRIAYRPVLGSERPSVNGWITRIEPNLVRPDGSIPLSSKVMFHHGVWLNASKQDATTPSFPERFYATGEEKTAMDLPDGFGYPYKKSDFWILNHMVHNLVPEPMTLYITYTVDFIPEGSPLDQGVRPVRPIWMDVENDDEYPVFDVKRGSGGRDGEFTYPTDAVKPYGDQEPKNEWTVDRDGVLVQTIGHVHTGGLSTELYLRREGAKYAGRKCAKRKRMTRKQKKNWSKKRKRKFAAKQKRVRKCRKKQPSVKGNRAHLFESQAHYFGDRRPVSWDVAMYGTKPNWRVAVKAGDTLELSTTYETKIASWYESMGINVVYMADPDVGGRNPYKKKVDYNGVLNHGRFPENNDHGGKGPVVGPDARKLPDGLLTSGPIMIGGYTWGAGDFRIPGSTGRPPVIEKGDSLTFKLSAGDEGREIWHSVTSCKAPCNKSTGISYPIPDGKFQFDSGQLGSGGAPTVNRTDWSTPKNLPVGTHTFFCRIHPLMRGAVRVVKPKR